MRKTASTVVRAGLCLGMLVLIGCMPFKPADPGVTPGELPETFAIYDGANTDAQPWWQTLASVELNRLIDTAQEDNLSLKEAWARLRQAKALAVAAGAERYPSVTANGSGEASRFRTHTTSTDTKWEDDYLLGLAGSYELDLWGRIRSQHEAALLDVSASQADLQTAAITLSAEVTERWLATISLRLQEALLEKQLASNQTFLELIELRFRKGMVSALDVYQQKQVVETVRAKLPLVKAEIRTNEHALAVLIGKSPRSDLKLVQDRMPVVGALPPVGLPADLLANRPDVRAAGMRLRAAQWQLAEARANRLPKLQLSADAQFGPADLDQLFDTWLLGLAASLTAPILDGGRLAATVDHADAQVDENLWTYRLTVLTAVKEVEDALENEARQHDYLKGLENVMDAARHGFEEAVQRYRRGLSDYLPVLTQLITLQGLERDLIVQQETLIRYRISLHRALGGGWRGLPDEMVAPLTVEHQG